MAHQVTIPPPGGGGTLVATGGDVGGAIIWTPSHDLSPREERNRIERAERLLGEVQGILTAPPSEPKD